MSITQITVPAGIIDLGVGDPSADLLPLAALDAAARRFFAAKNPAALQYGRSRGHPGLRRALAEFLAPAYGAPLDAEGIFICHGASGGLDLLCTLFTHPGDAVFVEEPTYFLALRIFADHGLRPVPLPMDTAGLDLDALEAALQRERPALLYSVPAFQNPSGRTLAAERRLRLAALSRQYGFMLVADEVYHLLDYGEGQTENSQGTGLSPGSLQPPAGFRLPAALRPPAMAALTHEETVVSLGSFSKILAPGLRLGWIIAHPAVIDRLAGCGLLDSGGGLAPFSSALACELIESGALAENVTHLRRVYSARRDAMHAALRQSAPQFQYSLPSGGFFFWLRLPGTDTAALQPRARQLGVDFRPGVRFSSRGGLAEYMRVGFSFYDEETLVEGVKRLGSLSA